MQSACRDTQTLVKHALGLYDIRTFNETKVSLQEHLDAFVGYVSRVLTSPSVAVDSSRCGLNLKVRVL